MPCAESEVSCKLRTLNFTELKTTYLGGMTHPSTFALEAAAMQR